MKNLKHLTAGAVCLLLCLSGTLAKAQNSSIDDANPTTGVAPLGDLNPEKPPYLPPLPPLPLDAAETPKVVVGFYPNPCQDQLRVETSTNEQVQITVYNLTGKVELTKAVQNESLIDVSQLKPGIYIINDGQSSSRLVKS